MATWFRLYTEVLDDPKVQTLPPNQFRFWVNCLCLASRNDGLLPPIADIAFSCRLSLTETGELLTSLLHTKLFEKRAGSIRPHKWEERQFKDGGANKGSKYVYFVKDPSARIVKVGFSKNPWARVVDIRSESSNPKLKVVATFRSKSVSEVDIHLLLSEFHHQFEWFEIPPKLLTIIIDYSKKETTYEDLVDLLRSKHGDLLRSKTTIPDTESETDTEQIQRQTEPHTSSGFDRFWKIYPRKVGKGDAEKVWIRRNLERINEEIFIALGIQIDCVDWNRDNGQFIPHPATWLNRKSWLDTPRTDGNGHKPNYTQEQLDSEVSKLRKMGAIR